MSAEFEGELPEHFPACEYRTGLTQCGSRTAVVRKAVGDIHVGVFCGAGHRRQFSDGLKSGYWVPQDLFAPGQPYEGVLPEWLFTFSDKKFGDGFDIPERVKRDVLLKQDRCAICNRPPCPTNEPNRVAAEWLNEHAADLASRVRECLSPQRPVGFEDWFAKLTSDLKFEVSRRIRDSKLQVDHGFPRRILSAAKSNLSPKLTAFARSGPLFAVCRVCNNGRSGRLVETRGQLTELYVTVYYDGLMDRFRADALRSTLFNALCDVVYDEQGMLRTSLSA
jgi:hypothetical protein